MAKLTDVIGTEMSGKGIQEPYKKGPSIFEALAKVSGTILDLKEGNDEMNAKREANARQAKKDARDEQSHQAKNWGAEALLALGGAEEEMNARADTQPVPAAAAPTTPTPLEKLSAPTDVGAGTTVPATPTQAELAASAGAMQEGDKIGQQAARLQAGVRQGRVSRAAYELQLENILRQGFAKFPDAKFELLEMMDKYGIDHPVMSEYRAAKVAEEKVTESSITREEGLINKAVELGYDPGEYSRDNLIKLAVAANKSEYQLKVNRDELDLAIKKADLNEKQRTQVMANHDEAMAQWMQTSFGPQVGATLDQVTSFVNDLSIPEPDRMKAMIEFVNVFQPRAYSLVNNYVDQAIAQGGMTREKANAVGETLKKRVDEMFLQFSPDNPLNVIKKNALIMDSMSKSLGLDIQEMMPIFSSFKQAFGGDSDVVKEMVDHIASSPQLQEAFTREMKGFTGLQLGDRTIRVKNMIAFMSGIPGLQDMSPQEAQNVLKDSSELMNKGFYKLALQGNPNAQKSVLGALGKVANAAVELNAGSSTQALTAASAYVANAQALATIRKATPENQELAGIVVDETRAATQKLLIALTKKSEGSEYHDLVLNRDKMRYELKPTGKKIAHKQSGNVTGGLQFNLPGQSIERIPPPSNQLLMLQEAANRNLGFLMQTHDYEDNAALKTATKEERLDFYTTGALPARIRPKAGESGVQLISRLQKFWDSKRPDYSDMPKIDVQERTNERSGIVAAGTSGRVTFKADGSREVPNHNGKPVVIPSVDQIADRFGKNPIYQMVIEKAREKGIPTDVAARLAYLESGGFKAQKNNNGSGAYGPMQVTQQNWDKEALQRYGKRVKDLSTEENIDMGMWILAERRKVRKGNIKEAVHDYIGRAHGDKNMRSADYAEVLAGEPDDEK